MGELVFYLVPFPKFALARQFYFYDWIHVDGFLARKQLSFYNPEGAQGNFSITSPVGGAKAHEVQSGFIG
jgi:hypothetical protein